VRREHEDAGLGELLADGARGLQSLRLVRGRHADVDQDEVWLVLADEGEELLGVAGLPHNLEARPLEQAGEALAEEDVVIGECDACGCRHRDDYL
jgi:hypothetical protein